MFDMNYTEPTNPWQVYETRKRQIIAMNLPQDAYEKAIQDLLKELGL